VTNELELHSSPEVQRPLATGCRPSPSTGDHATHTGKKRFFFLGGNAPPSTNPESALISHLRHLMEVPIPP